MEVFAKESDLLNKEGPKTDGLVFPSESCFITAILFCPSTIPLLPDNTIIVHGAGWEHADAWRSNRELLFDA
eukprot:12937986-Prorocentrum_lima.AAC.1